MDKETTISAEAGAVVEKKGLPTAAKVAIVAGGVVLAAAVTVGIVAFVRSRGVGEVSNAAD